MNTAGLDLVLMIHIDE